jgi:hypothetical protein
MVCFFLISCHGTAIANGLFVPALDGVWMNIQHWWNYNWKERWNTQKRTWSIATIAITNPTCICLKGTHCMSLGLRLGYLFKLCVVVLCPAYTEAYVALLLCTYVTLHTSRHLLLNSIFHTGLLSKWRNKFLQYRFSIWKKCSFSIYLIIFGASGVFLGSMHLTTSVLFFHVYVFFLSIVKCVIVIWPFWLIYCPLYLIAMFWMWWVEPFLLFLCRIICAL